MCKIVSKIPGTESKPSCEKPKRDNANFKSHANSHGVDG